MILEGDRYSLKMVRQLLNLYIKLSDLCVCVTFTTPLFSSPFEKSPLINKVYRPIIAIGYIYK